MTTLRTPRQPPGRELRPLTVQLDPDTHQQLRTLAAQEQRTISALARLAIEAYLADQSVRVIRHVTRDAEGLYGVDEHPTDTTCARCIAETR